jgi:hypothetical protein
MNDPSLLYLCVAAAVSAVLIAATLADRWRERKNHLSGGGNGNRSDAS